MKYKKYTRVKRIRTNQVFTIIEKKGAKRKAGSLIKREPIYLLKGPHPSLDLVVSKSELETLFIRV